MRLNAPVTKLESTAAARSRGRRRRRDVSSAAAVISSLPLRTTSDRRPGRCRPTCATPAAACATATSSPSSLVIDGADLFPDNWIYIHEPDVSVGRIQNFRSWSPWMVPNDHEACDRPRVLLLRGRRAVDHGRTRTLVELATRELEQTRAGRPARRSSAATSSACHKAYPVYDAEYAGRVADDPRLARRRSRTSSRSGATACTATTTRITRC